MGFLFSAPSAPKVAALPTVPPAATPPTYADASITKLGMKTARQAQADAVASLAGTVDTSPEGLTTPTKTAPASLLGGTSSVA